MKRIKNVKTFFHIDATAEGGISTEFENLLPREN